MGNVYSLQMKSNKWTKSSEDLTEGWTIEWLAHKTAPVTIYRCTGRIRVSRVSAILIFFLCGSSSSSSKALTGPQLARMFIDLKERRKWDPETQPTSMILGEISKTCELQYVAHGTVMGGLVSARDYVDVKMTDEKKEWRTLYRAIWGSVTWDPVIDKNCVRGWNYAQGVTFEPIEREEGMFQMQLSVHRDVKGWLPYTAADNAMPSALAWEWKGFRDHVQKAYPYAK